jgi:anti-sigma B factor antagonist
VVRIADQGEGFDYDNSAGSAGAGEPVAAFRPRHLSNQGFHGRFSGAPPGTGGYRSNFGEAPGVEVKDDREQARLRARRHILVSIKLSTRQVGDVSVVDVAGRITLGEGSSALRDLLREMVGKNQKKILLNLGDVSYIDSSGIGELVSGFTTVTNQGGQLKLLKSDQAG